MSASLPFAFGLPSGPDLIVILVIVLIVFGAKKIPEIARGLGQSLGEFKKARDEFEREVQKSSTATTPPETKELPSNQTSQPQPPSQPELPK